MNASPRTPASNPFSSHNLRPGGIPFIFPENESAADLVARLRASIWWGQIVGPHGSGKSTLIAALIPEIERAGKQPLLVTLHQGQRQLPPLAAPLSSATILVVDGYEQLSWWSKLRTKRTCRRAACGLLVTAHADMGFPTLYKTIPTVETAQQVSQQLLSEHADKLSGEDVAAAFDAAGGNIREALFALYDVYQWRK